MKNIGMMIATKPLTGLLDDYTRQAHAAMAEHLDLLEQEINCWRMYGVIVTQCMDELILECP